MLSRLATASLAFGGLDVTRGRLDVITPLTRKYIRRTYDISNTFKHLTGESNPILPANVLKESA